MDFLRYVKTLWKRLYTDSVLYGAWDNTVNPRYLIYSTYREPVSMLNDERTFNLDALVFLRKEGKLIDEMLRVEDKVKDAVPGGDDDDEIEDGGVPLFWEGDINPDSGAKFWYKENIIDVTVEEEGVNLTFYRPLSKPFANEDFEKWVIETEGDSRVSILVSRNGSMSVNSVTFDPPVISDLELNYGTGFGKVHEKVLARLNEKRAGLIIFHGSPGSGKSTYIKHLSAIVNREFIFVPVNMTPELASPSFIGTLMSHKDAILILEDAEQAVRERGNGGDDSVVSTLLNLSDGILGNILRITLIVSWNMDRQYVDKALLRRGRLLLEHDFTALNMEDAERLVKHLGKDIKVTEPMTLADIYGVQADETYVPKPRREMGFHTLIPTTPKKE